MTSVTDAPPATPLTSAAPSGVLFAVMTDPVAPQDLFATLFHVLGIDTTREFYTPQGRPIRLNTGSPLAKLLA